MMRGRKPNCGLRFTSGVASCLLLIIAGIVIAGCSSKLDLNEPPDIRYGEDACDRCLMIINEARYAAAYVTDEGETRRFDDIGGMLAYHQETPEDVAVFWVHDFDTETWLKADEAHFVMSDNLQTPMGFGIIAFTDQEQAESWALDKGGTVMSFSDLLEQSEELAAKLESAPGSGAHIHSE
jgi:copper chaperone NosL